MKFFNITSAITSQSSAQKEQNIVKKLPSIESSYACHFKSLNFIIIGFDN